MIFFNGDLRKASDLDTQVMDAVKRRTPSAQNITVSQVQHRFLDGLLYTVNFEAAAGEDTKGYTNRVYVTKNTIEPYGHDESLFQIVGARHSSKFYDAFANSEVVSGVIALIVTVFVVGTFSVSYFVESVRVVPDWITSGWLLILGFYFGKASGKPEN